jgi:hypothetical protein
MTAGRRRPARAASIALVTALVAGPGATRPARADAYDAMLIRAIAAKERALDLSEPGRWEEALSLFQSLDGIRSTRESKYEIGFAAERLRRQDLAVEAYEAALELGLTGSARGKAETFITGHATSMARLKLQGPANVRVRIAGIERGRLPLARPIVVFPGRADLELHYPDGRTTTRSVTLAAGQVGAVDLESPGAGEGAGVAGAGGGAAAASAARDAEAHPAEVPTGADLIPPAAPTEPRAPADAAAPGGPPVAGWVLLGAGAVVATAGAVMLPVTSNRLDAERAELDVACRTLIGTDDCAFVEPGEGMREKAQRHVDAIVTWKALRIVSWVSLGVGLVTAGAGGLMVLSGGSSAPSGKLARLARLLPVATPTSSGLTLTWSGRY